MTLFGITYSHRQMLYLAGDLLAALLAISLSHALRFGVGTDLLEILRQNAGASVIFFSTNLLFLYVAEAYDGGLDFREPVLILRLWMAALAALLVQMALFYAFPSWWWGRGVAGLSSLSFAVLAIGWRAGVCWLRPRPPTRLNTLIVGTGKAAHLIADTIRKHPEHGLVYDLVGFVDARGTGDLSEAVASTVPIVGTAADLGVVIAERRVGMLIVATSGRLSSQLTAQLLECKAQGVRIEDMPTIYKRLTGKVPIFHLSDTWLLFGPAFSGTHGLGAAAQRLADIVIALVGLTLAAPVIGLAAVAIRLESPGPAFFLQERVGLGERPFTIIKLRTMRQDAEATSGPVWSQGSGDPRVTRVGRFLRRSRIDELPQFYNILRGDMSLVGPRPERAHFVGQLKKQIPFYGLRFAVKPGVTGWAQVKYRYAASEEDAAEKLCYDLYAVQELSPLLYLLIVLKTVQTVVLRPGS